MFTHLGPCWPILAPCGSKLGGLGPRAMLAHPGAMLVDLGSMLAYPASILAYLGAKVSRKGSNMANMVSISRGPTPKKNVKKSVLDSFDILANIQTTQKNNMKKVVFHVFWFQVVPNLLLEAKMIQKSSHMANIKPSKANIWPR